MIKRKSNKLWLVKKLSDLRASLVALVVKINHKDRKEIHKRALRLIDIKAIF